MDRMDIILEECKNKKVLDIGCTGIEGRLHKKISQVSSRVIGVDINKEEIEEMNNNGYEVYCQNAGEFY